MPKVNIIGAGPGGLTAGMILAHRGFEVNIFEKENKVGGRNACIEQDGFKFDIGPTFLMMKFILDEVFQESGKDISKYLKFTRLDPMYQLKFKNKSIDISDKKLKMINEIKEKFPGEEQGLQKFMEKENIRFKRMYPCLQKDYGSLKQYFSKDLIKALPHLSFGKSMFNVLGDYFTNQDLKLSFTFQSKYLGMSPWDCPGAFTMIPYLEHEFGIFHVEGGLSEISEAMAKAIKEEEGKIFLNSKVKEVILKNKSIKGIKLENGEEHFSDITIINADFAHAMSTLIPKGKLKKYSKENLKKKKYSCSTFMLYLAVDKLYDQPHHKIIFADDYKENVEKIFDQKKISKDFSLYVRNASATDKTLAPKGKSALYILVPVPNNKSKINWQEEKSKFRKEAIEKLEKNGYENLSKHIIFEKTITPLDWEKQGIYLGATFNLAHNLDQMLYKRPHNKFEELENCYLVGGGTHPGSGLPTIYESGRIASNLICKEFKVPFTSLNIQIK